MTEIKDLKEGDLIELSGTRPNDEELRQTFIVQTVIENTAAVVLSKRRKSVYRLVGTTLMKTWDEKPRRIASYVSIEVVGKYKGRGRPKAEDSSPFDEEMTTRICQVLNGIWDEVGGDVLQCIEDCGDAKRGRATMPRLDVMEICTDAQFDRVKQSDPEVYEAVRTHLRHGSALWKAIAKKAFPYKRYGW